MITKLISAGSIGLALFFYLIGWQWFLPIVILVNLTLLPPMPAVFDSWLSRSVVGLIFLYALLQLASLIQFIIDPSGHFKLIATIAGLLSIGLVWLFNDFQSLKNFKLIKLKDLFIGLILLLFILPFSSILTGPNRTEKVATIASTQIADSVAHYGSIAGFAKVQNLDYRLNYYYPSGFHISTAFIEDSLLGNINNLSWKANVALYFLQYIVGGFILGFILIYFGYSLLETVFLKRNLNHLDYLTVAVSLGLATLILHLWLFVNEGFINFFYVCAALLVSFVFLLEWSIDQKSEAEPGNISDHDIWTLTAFLLLGFGATFSWPLFVPAVLFSAFLVTINLPFRRWLSKNQLLFSLPVLGLAIANLISLIFQFKYMTNGGQVIKYGGGITSFNAPLILIGLAALTYLIAKNFKNSGRSLTIMALPYLILVGALLSWQLFVLGQVRYYVIKTSMVVEMIGLACTSVSLVALVRQSNQGRWLRFGWVVVSLMFIIMATISLEPLPLQEVRGLFRNASSLGKPPFVDSDVASIASLGSKGQIKDFNVTILHYDNVGKRYYAQIETALWANAMTKTYTDASMSITGSRSSNCFAKQFSILAYGTGSPTDQTTLIKNVNSCINASRQKGLSYFIVTDRNSLAELHHDFGNKADYVIN